MMRETVAAFRAMNTTIQLVIVAEPDNGREVVTALQDVENLFADVEGAISRFRPESELSCLNQSDGRQFQASPLLFTLVARALAAARQTDGIFDPTILGPLVAAGYDRSFESLDRARGAPASSPEGLRPHSWRDVDIDTEARSIALPRGCGLDLGGIGKGCAADRAADLLRRFQNFAVDAGGDIFVSGTQFNGRPWTVAVEDPFNMGSDLLTITARDQAVATSTTARRHWAMGGKEKHHLIDPRTGLPSERDVVSATVVTNSVTRAEVLAKVALLLGSDLGLRFLNGKPDVEGLLVLRDGKMQYTRDFKELKHVA